MEQSCLIHCTDSDSDSLKIFSEIRWRKVRDVSEDWSVAVANTGAREEEIAQRLLATESQPENACFHEKCYSKFVNKRRISQARKRGKAQIEINTSAAATPHQERVRAKKVVITRTTGVLPAQCIICKKVKWKQNKATCKRAPEKLMQVG